MDTAIARSHWKTAASILASLVLLIPAIILVSLLWRFSGLEIPNEQLSNTWLPAFLAYPVRLIGTFSLGCAGAGLAFLGATSLIKGASVEAASYAVASILGTLTIGLMAIVVAADQNFMAHADTLAQGVGFVVGTFAAAASQRSQ